MKQVKDTDVDVSEKGTLRVSEQRSGLNKGLKVWDSRFTEL